MEDKCEFCGTPHKIKDGTHTYQCSCWEVIEIKNIVKYVADNLLAAEYRIREQDVEIARLRDCVTKWKASIQEQLDDLTELRELTARHARGYESADADRAFDLAQRIEFELRNIMQPNNDDPPHSITTMCSEGEVQNETDIFKAITGELIDTLHDLRYGDDAGNEESQ